MTDLVSRQLLYPGERFDNSLKDNHQKGINIMLSRLSNKKSFLINGQISTQIPAYDYYTFSLIKVARKTDSVSLLTTQSGPS